MRLYLVHVDKVLMIENEDDVRHLASYFLDAKPPEALAAYQGSPPQLLSSTASGIQSDMSNYSSGDIHIGDGGRRQSLELPSSLGETASPSVAESERVSPTQIGTPEVHGQFLCNLMRFTGLYFCWRLTCNWQCAFVCKKLCYSWSAYPHSL